MANSNEVDFRIIRGRTVWLHNQSFKTGSEQRLQDLGFTTQEKRRQVWKRNIVFLSGAPNKVDCTPTALDLAKAENVDLAQVVGTGPRGRVYKSDVEAYIAEHGSQTSEVSSDAGNNETPEERKS